MTSRKQQPYPGHVAARAIFIFEHEQCGYVALLCIGMVEVSTCVIESPYIVCEGDDPVEVKRGDEIGHFEFGGSTHVSIFQKDKALLEDWAINAMQHQNDPYGNDNSDSCGITGIGLVLQLMISGYCHSRKRPPAHDSFSDITLRVETDNHLNKRSVPHRITCGGENPKSLTSRDKFVYYGNN